MIWQQSLLEDASAHLWQTLLTKVDQFTGCINTLRISPILNMMVSEEKMIEAAQRLFKQQGVRSTSMHDVARACRASLQDVTLIFTSKKDLMLAVFKHAASKKTAHLSIVSALSPSAVSELNTIFKFVSETIDSLGAEFHTELKRYQPLALDQLNHLVDETLIPCLQKNMQRGLSEGFYRTALDTELYATTYFSILRGVLESDRDWTQTIKAISLLNDIFLHGVLNAKGLRI